jgi:histidyl-tRNA synthetase
VTGIEAPRGTHDILPADQPLWRKVTGEMERLCALYGYRPIQTPVFEDTELFTRTSGQGSDVVQKEMYTFTDRGDRSLTLRPEGTAPLCRAYLQHGMHREPQPVKLYTIGSMYRYAAPQRGRYREHWQLSVEAIGSADPAVDAEVIELYRTLLETLGVTEFELRLNSIGDPACRPAYLERLNAWLDANDDALDDEARQKRATSPLRVFDVKSPEARAALADAPTIGESLCAECSAHFDEVRRYLEAYGVAYVIDPTLVRGLDYYTRTTWEFLGPDEGVQAATLSGGGRYDGLVEEIGGPPTPGIGFGAGIERLILALEREGISAEQPAIDVFITVDEDADRAAVLVELAKLRRDGLRCDTDYAGRSAKGQMTQAGRLGARIVVRVMGDKATLRSEGADLGEPIPISQIATAVRGTPAHHPL